MGRSSETFGKKENEKKKQKKQQDKKAKAEERRATGGKGKSLEDMMAYIDENGNISSKPPEFRPKVEIDVADIVISAPKQEAQADDGLERGVIAFYNAAKGFGFIRGTRKGDQVFFHDRQLKFPVKENIKVTYVKEAGPKGWVAVNILKDDN